MERRFQISFPSFPFSPETPDTQASDDPSRFPVDACRLYSGNRQSTLHFYFSDFLSWCCYTGFFFYAPEVQYLVASVHVKYNQTRFNLPYKYVQYVYGDLGFLWNSSKLVMNARKSVYEGRRETGEKVYPYSVSTDCNLSLNLLKRDCNSFKIFRCY